MEKRSREEILVDTLREERKIAWQGIKECDEDSTGFFWYAGQLKTAERALLKAGFKLEYPDDP